MKYGVHVYLTPFGTSNWERFEDLSREHT
jgi:hypothetical protein